MNGTFVSEWIVGLGIWPLLVMLAPNVVLFRKHGAAANRKRSASLYQAIAVFLITSAATGVVAFGLTDAYLWGAIVIVAIAAYLLRKRLFPYTRTCPECGHVHNLLSEELRNVYVFDDNLCDSCRATK